MKIKRIEAFMVNKQTEQQIVQLLKSSFSSFPGNQSFYNQAPHFRYLVFEKKVLIGHMAVIYRMINIAGETAFIFGIADFCIDKKYQSKKIASTLLTELTALAQSQQIDFLILIASEHDFYLKNNFKLVQNTCRWLMINDFKTMGVGHRKINDSLMVKQVGDKVWKDGVFDFMGHVF